MGLWSRLNGRVGRRPEPRDVTEPPPTAYGRAAEIGANIQARNRLRQGQVDTLTGKARARD